VSTIQSGVEHRSEADRWLAFAHRGRSPWKLGGEVVTENLRIHSANPTDADELLAIRRDAIMALAVEYGRVAAERWATAAHPDRAAKAIATNSVWVTQLGSKVVGWVEVSGATIESLYVSPAAARLGVGSSLLTHAERQIRDAGASIAYLDASPNAEAFYARRGYRRVGEVKGRTIQFP
jgi:putative acetyltransferase